MSTQLEPLSCNAGRRKGGAERRAAGLAGACLSWHLTVAATPSWDFVATSSVQDVHESPGGCFLTSVSLGSRVNQPGSVVMSSVHWRHVAYNKSVQAVVGTQKRAATCTAGATATLQLPIAIERNARRARGTAHGWRWCARWAQAAWPRSRLLRCNGPYPTSCTSSRRYAQHLHPETHERQAARNSSYLDMPCNGLLRLAPCK